MTTLERRAEIMRILVARRRETAPRLAAEFGVCINMIRNDIFALTVDYSLETQQGNGGGVNIARWEINPENILTLQRTCNVNLYHF